MPTLYLGLGSNLGDRAQNLRRALAGLPPGIKLEAVSRCYETEPAYVLDQPRFYNLACRAHTHLAPPDVLQQLKALEVELGRESGERYGPRVVDLDLLLYGEEVVELPGLSVPHPRLHERAFVLVPLAEVGADAVHPGLGLTVAALRQRLGETGHLVWPAPECDRVVAGSV